ncbi:MAG: Gfo/Idh/MocA family oxidoreductase [Legionella sp.]|nr:Gfo/Idh/MocA family oxidoreductase [Legionella sp.]
MDTICVFGGGRWGRVLLGVLSKSFPHLKLIIWVCRHGYAQNLIWLQAQNFLHVKIVQEESLAWEYTPQAVIVANASHLHGHTVKEAILRQIPVLTEKPFCLSPDEAREIISLSKKNSVVVGVNFEFIYASYLNEFKKYLTHVSVHTISLIWEDPFSEMRMGEQKYGDIYTPLMYDSFQHCYSIINFLWPEDILELRNVTYDVNSSVLVELVSQSKNIKIHLSRRADNRKRKISVNEEKIILDFTSEPGFLSMNGKILQNEWLGMYPLPAVFSDFFEMISQPSQSEKWPLNITNWLDVVYLSAQADALLKKSQQALLSQVHPLLSNSSITRHLLVDMFLPELSISGEYQRAHSLQEEVAFSDRVIDMMAQK